MAFNLALLRTRDSEEEEREESGGEQMNAGDVEDRGGDCARVARKEGVLPSNLTAGLCTFFSPCRSLCTFESVL